ncbi:MAG: hydroxymethylglutaryl-CoA lyase [Schleiferiaceae bacterium]|nr:hydroxymethylglutaryl-CoA lyase [Schleiferiaceae bacterium]
MTHKNTSPVRVIECPRDAMQGIKPFIPTEKKVSYIQSLLQVGFDTLDCGSFVSPKVIPQMRDTAAVLQQLDLSESKTKLLTIVANERGAAMAVDVPQVTYLGYPFSVSETFQLRNTNRTIAQSAELVDQLLERCAHSNKELVVYLSMGFGNPYGDDWSVALVEDWAGKLYDKGVRIINLSDTIGTSNPTNIAQLFTSLLKALPEVDFGAHLHTTLPTWHEKIHAAYSSGCRRFDSAIKGLGGCPMATDSLTGNMPTEKLLSYLTAEKAASHINMLAFESSYNKALQTFPH